MHLPECPAAGNPPAKRTPLRTSPSQPLSQMSATTTDQCANKESFSSAVSLDKIIHERFLVPAPRLCRQKSAAPPRWPATTPSQSTLASKNVRGTPARLSSRPAEAPPGLRVLQSVAQTHACPPVRTKHKLQTIRSPQPSSRLPFP